MLNRHKTRTTIRAGPISEDYSAKINVYVNNNRASKNTSKFWWREIDKSTIMVGIVNVFDL